MACCVLCIQQCLVHRLLFASIRLKGKTINYVFAFIVIMTNSNEYGFLDIIWIGSQRVRAPRLVLSNDDRWDGSHQLFILQNNPAGRNVD
mmetsp:Transcript_24351/g.58778  ORF Transcript_24351/g.58778 Transcript_24351/m.58778 type:complete len:90 (-) Transcript_24351:156-425(-)